MYFGTNKFWDLVGAGLVDAFEFYFLLSIALGYLFYGAVR
jgi:hypothetical protein